MDTLSVVIVIIVGCIIFKIITWYLICTNAKDEKRRLKSHQNLKPGRPDRLPHELLRAVDIERQINKTPKDDDAITKQETTTTTTTTIDETVPPQAEAEKPAAALDTSPDSNTKQDTAGTAAVDSGQETDTAGEPGSSESKTESGPDLPKSASLAVGGVVGGAAAASIIAATSASSPEPAKDKADEEQASATLPVESDVPTKSENAEPKPEPGIPDPNPDLKTYADLDPQPKDRDLPTQPASDLEPPPPVIVPSVGGAGILALAVGQAEEPSDPTVTAAELPPVKPERKKKKKKKLTSLKKVLPASDPTTSQEPVSDFDDYRSIQLKHLPPPDDSSPPPAEYKSPPAPRAPPRTSRQIIQQRQKMEKKLKDQEGMDF